MRLVFIVFLYSFLTLSCNIDDENSQSAMLGFKHTLMVELGDGKYDSFRKLAQDQSMETKYINDIIYVSYYKELNACGHYTGDVTFLNDTIKLQIKSISNTSCTSRVIDRVTFLIDNPEEKKMIIVKESF